MELGNFFPKKKLLCIVRCGEQAETFIRVPIRVLKSGCITLVT